MSKNEIMRELSRQNSQEDDIPIGEIASIARSYSVDSNRLLGLLLKIDFEESSFVTCDPWKRKCGGVPRGAFVIFRIDPKSVDPEDKKFCDRLVLARVTNSAPTPVESNIQQTLFQVHKLRAELDPLTHKELQWGAFKASIVGTYFDLYDKKTDTYEIGFGNDVDTFFSPFAYVAYMPTEEHLERLINSFVKCENPVTIGELRYTETRFPDNQISVPIKIDPKDIVGEPNAAQRLANFGKTRFGKSNSNKIISQAVFKSALQVSQVFFDPSGEYTYINDQDGTSLFALNHKKSIRYSLSPRELRGDEKMLGLTPANLMKVDFYRFPSIGHGLIVNLWYSENNNLPGYLRPILDWSPDDNSPPQSPESEYNHYWRTMGLWYAILYKAEFSPPPNFNIPMDFRANVKNVLLEIPGVSKDNNGRFNTYGQPVSLLPQIYKVVSRLYRENGNARDWFPDSANSGPYFNDTEEKLLKIFDSSNNYTGHNYFRPFNKYHSPQGGSIFEEIADHIENGKSIFIDMAQSNETVRINLAERVCRTIFQRQNKLFNSEKGVGNKFILIYFEEAHRLFRKDDSDLNSIYNMLAKEGAKFNIGMIYSTQSMTTISPDLVKNTDNFLIAHLDDDREAREVSRKYAFKDVADDVQRIQSKGFVRMITKSHRFALPTQIKLFEKPKN